MNYVCGCGGYMTLKGDVLVITRVDGDRPHQVWQADLWECLQCRNQIAAGFGGVPIATAGNVFFESMLSRAKDRRHIVCTLS